jgi:hypothetical protein
VIGVICNFESAFSLPIKCCICRFLSTIIKRYELLASWWSANPTFIRNFTFHNKVSLAQLISVWPPNEFPSSSLAAR